MNRIGSTILSIGNSLAAIASIILLGSGDTVAYVLGGICATGSIVCFVQTASPASVSWRLSEGMMYTGLAFALLLVFVGLIGAIGIRPPGVVFGWLYLLVGGADAMVLSRTLRSKP